MLENGPEILFGVAPPKGARKTGRAVYVKLPERFAEVDADCSNSWQKRIDKHLQVYIMDIERGEIIVDGTWCLPADSPLFYWGGSDAYKEAIARPVSNAVAISTSERQVIVEDFVSFIKRMGSDLKPQGPGNIIDYLRSMSATSKEKDLYLTACITVMGFAFGAVLFNDPVYVLTVAILTGFVFGIVGKHLLNDGVAKKCETIINKLDNENSNEFYILKLRLAAASRGYITLNDFTFSEPKAFFELFD
jgi:hypothetical protein